MAEPTRVLVVDDSAVVRQTLMAVLSPEEGFAVETAADPLIAMRKMERAAPKVIVLDLEMPRMADSPSCAGSWPPRIPSRWWSAPACPSPAWGTTARPACWR